MSYSGDEVHGFHHLDSAHHFDAVEIKSADVGVAGWLVSCCVSGSDRGAVHVAAKAAETVAEAVTMMKSTFRRKKI